LEREGCDIRGSGGIAIIIIIIIIIIIMIIMPTEIVSFMFALQ